jgi:hypothetical protein
MVHPFLQQASGQIDKDDVNCAGILEQSMGARNRVGLGLSYRPARIPESIPWNPFLGSLKIKNSVSVFPSHEGNTERRILVLSS